MSEDNDKKLKAPIVVDDAFLFSIKQIVANGAIYDKEIYPLLDINPRTWSRLKVKYPIIEETIEKEKALRYKILQKFASDILTDPKHKDHAKMVKHHLDRMDRFYGKQKVQIVKEEETSVADSLSGDALTELLDEFTEKTDQERTH